jgi:hypothetical protein
MSCHKLDQFCWMDETWMETLLKTHVDTLHHIDIVLSFFEDSPSAVQYSWHVP